MWLPTAACWPSMSALISSFMKPMGHWEKPGCSLFCHCCWCILDKTRFFAEGDIFDLTNVSPLPFGVSCLESFSVSGQIWQQDKGIGSNPKGLSGSSIAILTQYFQLLKNKLSCGGILLLHSGTPIFEGAPPLFRNVFGCLDVHSCWDAYVCCIHILLICNVINMLSFV